MFGWKPLLVGAVIVGGLNVYNTYDKASRAHDLQQKTEMLEYVAGEMERSAQAMVDGDLVTRIQVRPIPRSNRLRVTFSTTAELAPLKAFSQEAERDVSAAVCSQVINTLSGDSRLTIQVLMETPKRERGVDFEVSKAVCEAKGFG